MTGPYMKHLAWVLAGAVAAAAAGSARAQTGGEIQKKLNARVDFQAIDDPKVTLKDVLEFISDKYGLTFVIDDAAFRAAGVAEAAGKNVKAKEAKNTPLKTVLADVLKQAGAAYTVRSDHVLIVPARRR